MVPEGRAGSEGQGGWLEAPWPQGTMGTDVGTAMEGLALPPSQTVRSPAGTSVSKTSTQQDLA